VAGGVAGGGGAGRAVGPGLPASAEPDIVRARPVRLRRVAAVIAVAVVLTFAVVALLLGNTRSEGVIFGPGDQAAMLVLGLLIAGGVLLLARPSVTADVRGVRVRNILVSHDLPWEVVREVAYRDGSPWAILELADDDQVALLAVQSADRERAVVAVRGLRALQARHAAGGAAVPRGGEVVPDARTGEGPESTGRSHGVT
jgi:hypothetical protein